MYIFRIIPIILHETPGGASAPGAGGVGGQGAQLGTPQAGAPAQGQAPVQPTAQNGDFWNLFPNVPQEQRALLEPHIREQMGYITQLEQRVAPFKPFIDAGVTSAEDVQGLVRFSQAYEQDPRGTWLRMARQLYDSGVLHQDLDVEALEKIVTGQPLEDEPDFTGQEGVDPHVAQLMETIQGLRTQVQSLTQAEEARQQSQAETRQNEQLQAAFTSMRGELKAAGFPEDALNDETLRGALVVARGNVQQAIQNLVATRTALLQGFTQTRNGNQPPAPETPQGVPPSKTPRSRRGGSRSAFDSANQAAQQMLERRVRPE